MSTPPRSPSMVFDEMYTLPDDWMENLSADYATLIHEQERQYSEESISLIAPALPVAFSPSSSSIIETKDEDDNAQRSSPTASTAGDIMAHSTDEGELYLPSISPPPQECTDEQIYQQWVKPTVDQLRHSIQTLIMTFQEFAFPVYCFDTVANPDAVWFSPLLRHFFVGNDDAAVLSHRTKTPPLIMTTTKPRRGRRPNTILPLNVSGGSGASNPSALTASDPSSLLYANVPTFETMIRILSDLSLKDFDVQEETMIMVYDRATTLHLFQMATTSTTTDSSGGTLSSATVMPHKQSSLPAAVACVASPSSLGTIAHMLQVTENEAAPKWAQQLQRRRQQAKLHMGVSSQLTLFLSSLPKSPAYKFINNGFVVCPVLVFLKTDPRISKPRHHTAVLPSPTPSATATTFSSILPLVIPPNNDPSIVGITLIANLVEATHRPVRLNVANAISIASLPPAGSHHVMFAPFSIESQLLHAYCPSDFVRATTNIAIASASAITTTATTATTVGDDKHGHSDLETIKDTYFSHQAPAFIIRRAYPGCGILSLIKSQHIWARFLPNFSTLLTPERRALFMEEELAEMDAAMEDGTADTKYNYVLPTPKRFYLFIDTDKSMDASANIRLDQLRHIHPVNTTAVSQSISAFDRCATENTRQEAITLDPQHWVIPDFPKHLVHEDEGELPSSLSKNDGDMVMAASTISNPDQPHRTILQIRRSVTYRVYLGQRTAVAQDGRVSLELLETNEFVRVTCFDVVSEDSIHETILSTRFASLLAYYLQDYETHILKTLRPLATPDPMGLHLPTESLIVDICQHLVLNHKFDPGANYAASMMFHVPARWAMSVTMTFSDLGYYVENDLFAPRKWQLRYFTESEMYDNALRELEYIFSQQQQEDNDNDITTSAAVAARHVKIASEYPLPFATFIRLALCYKYHSPVFTSAWLEANGRQMFVRPGAVTCAQKDQIADAYFWTYLAPFTTRIQEYKVSLLDIYTYQGLYATTVYPHYSSGRNRGRSSASGMLRQFSKQAHQIQLPSKFIITTPEGSLAASPHPRAHKIMDIMKAPPSNVAESTTTTTALKINTTKRRKR